MVIKSRNPDLFPELNIPRTTALYWIRQSKERIRLKQIKYDDALLDKIEKLEADLQKEKAKNLFVKEFFSKITDKQAIYSKTKNKEGLVKTILKFKRIVSTAEMCRTIGLKESIFYRYKIDVFGCEKNSFKTCKILSPNQLTFREQQKIYDLATDPKLSYLSIKGLQYYAFRNGILACSYDSWRKYVREFRGARRKKHTKKYREGIRAQRPNQIWHIDITEFRLKDGKKAYLQVIVDNFSRKVLNWKFSQNKKAALSISTITAATKSKIPEVLMADGGGENSAHQVRAMLHGKGITSLIAKKDTMFSNSMIEGYFNILKNHFLQKHKRYKLAKLYKAVERSVEDFNDSPLPVLSGARPNELFENRVSRDVLKEQFKQKVRSTKILRPALNRKCLRQKCSIPIS